MNDPDTPEPNNVGTPDGPPEPNGYWTSSRPTILIPVAVLEEETVPEALVEFTAPLAVVVLGYHELPDQTAPGQARLQFEHRADEALTAIAAEFANAGADVETRLVFTPDIDQTVERIADELDCDAVLVPGTLTEQSVHSVLLPKRGPIEMDRVLSILATLVHDTDITVTMFHATDDEVEATDGRMLLRDAADLLEEQGIHPDRITTRVVVTDAPIAAISKATMEHDLVIVGESEPSLGSIVFGEVHERVAAAANRPVIVIRREIHEDEGPTDPPDAELDGNATKHSPDEST